MTDGTCQLGAEGCSRGEKRLWRRVARRQASPESSEPFPGWLIGPDKQDGD